MRGEARAQSAQAIGFGQKPRPDFTAETDPRREPGLTVYKVNNRTGKNPSYNAAVHAARNWRDSKKNFSDYSFCKHSLVNDVFHREK